MDLNLLEKSVVVTLMWMGVESFLENSHGLRAEMFSVRECRWTYEVMLDRALKGLPVNDLLMLERDLAERRHPEVNLMTLMELTTSVNPVLELKAYVAELCDQYRRRKMMMEFNALMHKCEDVAVPLDKTVAEAMNVLSGSNDTTEEETICLSDVLGQIWQRVLENADGRQQEGFPTGFERLDKCGGLHPR